MKKKEDIKKLNEAIRQENKRIAEFNYKNAPMGYIPFMETLKNRKESGNGKF
jgi:hypothetical protein